MHEVKGGLGKGVIVVVPACVAGVIRDTFLNPDGKYMGHKDFQQQCMPIEKIVYINLFQRNTNT